MSLLNSGESSSSLKDPVCLSGSSQNLRFRVDMLIFVAEEMKTNEGYE